MFRYHFVFNFIEEWKELIIAPQKVVIKSMAQIISEFMASIHFECQVGFKVLDHLQIKEEFFINRQLNCLENSY